MGIDTSYCPWANFKSASVIGSITVPAVDLIDAESPGTPHSRRSLETPSPLFPDSTQQGWLSMAIKGRTLHQRSSLVDSSNSVCVHVSTLFQGSQWVRVSCTLAWRKKKVAHVLNLRYSTFKEDAGLKLGAGYAARPQIVGVWCVHHSVSPLRFTTLLEHLPLTL